MEKLFFWLPKCIINGHVHGRDMNQANKTTVAQTLYEAESAGISIVNFMGNTSPPIDNLLVKDRYLRLIDRARGSNGYRVQGNILFAITDYNLDECAKALDDPRVVALKEFQLAEDGKSVTTGSCGVKYRATTIAGMEMCARKHKPYVIHCDDPQIIAAEGYTIRAEVECVRQKIDCARQVPGVKVIICHVSCQESAELILAAQREGLLIMIEVCAQYLWFDNERTNWRPDLPENFYLCLNRLRSKKDREYLINLVCRDSNLIIVSADHAPHSRIEKLANPNNIPSGIPSIFHTVPALLSELIPRKISPAQVARLLSYNYADFFGWQIDRELEEVEIVERADDFLYNNGVVENPWLGSKMFFPVWKNQPAKPQIFF